MIDRLQEKCPCVLLLLVPCFTICWYYTSSKSSISIQQLFEEYEKWVDELGEEREFPVSSLMIVLTALQMISGLCVGCILLFIVQSGSRHKEFPKAFNRSEILVGSLHFFGFICTNMGFAYGSASVVQVIKLMEPIETLILTAIVMNSWNEVTFARSVSVVMIVAGTSLLLLEEGIEQNVNVQSVTYALLSGVCMAGRNVIKKSAKYKKEDPDALLTKTTEVETPREKKKEKNCKEAFADGLANFCSITAVATIPAIFSLILIEMIESAIGTYPSFSVWITCTADEGKEAVFYHGLFNIFSITVLILISAQTHSLLNVGKRIVNVIAATIAFHENLGPDGFIGMVIAAVGGILYSWHRIFETKLKLSKDQNNSDLEQVEPRSFVLLQCA